jgi:hypothetical protein
MQSTFTQARLQPAVLREFLRYGYQTNKKGRPVNNLEHSDEASFLQSECQTMDSFLAKKHYKTKLITLTL